MVYTDFIPVHGSTSANASLLQQLCALQIFVCVTWIETQRTSIGRCRPMQNNKSLNTPLICKKNKQVWKKSETWNMKSCQVPLRGVWTQNFLKHIECCNFQTTIIYKSIFSGMEMSQRIHFWYQILLKMKIFWENDKKLLFWSKIFVTS